MAKKKARIDPTFANWLGEKAKRLPPTELTEELDAVYLAGPTEIEMRQAKTALEETLRRELPPKIFYDRLNDSPLGPIWVAASGRRLLAVEYGQTEEDFLVYLNKLIKGRYELSTKKMAWAIRDVLAYLNGERKSLELDVDLSTMTSFQRKVLNETSKVPRGQVATYAQIAKRIGNPKAVRAVGQALRRNPIPIVVPCHRVIASDGTLGGYGGRMGDERKVKLLKLEGVVFA